jgi:hypothetical protein
MGFPVSGFDLCPMSLIQGIEKREETLFKNSYEDLPKMSAFITYRKIGMQRIWKFFF